MTTQCVPNEERATAVAPRVKFPWEEQLRNSGIDVTLMVPCLNEEGNVAAALDTIRMATSQLNIVYEVIVIDDGSTDATSDKVRQYQTQHPHMPLSLHRNEVN